MDNAFGEPPWSPQPSVCHLMTALVDDIRRRTERNNNYGPRVKVDESVRGLTCPSLPRYIKRAGMRQLSVQA